MRGAPQWLRGLVSEEFSDACAAHPGERKKNHFCIDCAAALCRQCLPHDPAHDVIQIWKFMSSFVVRVDDLKLFDCAGIQTHTLSDHEVVFLKERIARKRSSTAENPCAACPRLLPAGDDYCSLFCKVSIWGRASRAYGTRSVQRPAAARMLTCRESGLRRRRTRRGRAAAARSGIGAGSS